MGAQDRVADLRAEAQRMRETLSRLRVEQARARADGTDQGPSFRPPHWMQLWGLSRRSGEADIAASLVLEGRHEYYIHTINADGVTCIECCCGALIPGMMQTVTRKQFFDAPGHVLSQDPVPLMELTAPDPWLTEEWSPAARRFTRRELLTALEEERRTLIVLSRQMKQADRLLELSGTTEWLAGGQRHLSRLNDRIHAVVFGEHRPFVHEEDGEGLWWAVCTCGARIEGHLGVNLNMKGFRGSPQHLSLRKPLEADMEVPVPDWLASATFPRHT